MKADIEESNSLARNSEAIQAVKDEYLLDLQHLYECQADSYHQEMMDRYLSNDESWYQPHNTDKSTKKLQVSLNDKCQYISFLHGSTWPEGRLYLPDDSISPT